jgi:hypothetical protein
MAPPIPASLPPGMMVMGSDRLQRALDAVKQVGRTTALM